jgi:alpha-L-fucosidase
MNCSIRQPKNLLLLIFLLFSVISKAQHKDYFPDPDPLVQKKLESWQDMKFGLLMHWGPYSQWGIVESWSICPEDLSWASGARLKKDSVDYASYVKKYEALQTTFNPTKFNPQKWAAAAKDAGMKYVVFTTKHHDGFCMFDTRTTDYKITDPKTPFSSNPKKDVTKEIFDVFRQQGFWIGAYFSKPDWHTDSYWWKRYPASDRNPSYSIAKHPAQWQKFVDYTHTQINELMSNYGKVDILWLDGGWVRKKTDEELKKDMLEVYEGSRWARNPQSQDINMPLLVKNARVKQPGLIVVDREVPGPYQNYLTPEQHIPETGLPYPWETCMTMGGSWSYTPTDVYKPTKEILKKLIDIISKGGNYLLNIGPGPDGEWSDSAYARLHEIGQWMKINNSAVYGTRTYSVFGEGDQIRFAQSKEGETRFIYLFDFPQQPLNIRSMKINKGERVTLLGADKELAWEQAADGVRISIPSSLKNVTNHVWVLKVE